jgi:hypothetical protein
MVHGCVRARTWKPARLTGCSTRTGVSGGLLRLPCARGAEARQREHTAAACVPRHAHAPRCRGAPTRRGPGPPGSQSKCQGHTANRARTAHPARRRAGRQARRPGQARAAAAWRAQHRSRLLLATRRAAPAPPRWGRRRQRRAGCARRAARRRRATRPEARRRTRRSHRTSSPARRSGAARSAGANAHAAHAGRAHVIAALHAAREAVTQSRQNA